MEEEKIMGKSKFATKLDRIQDEVFQHLKKMGYRKRRRTFNRNVDDGLVHVINFQMGSYPPANFVEIPNIRPNLYGKFTVNLGVFVPETHRLERGKEIPDFIQEYDCEIRSRLGHLITPGDDIWWSLEHDHNTLCREMLRLIDDYALPYLSRFSTRQAIIWEWKRHGRDIGLPPRGNLSIAIILASQGNMDKATKLIQKEYSGAQRTTYAEFVKIVAGKLGIMNIAESDD